MSWNVFKFCTALKGLGLIMIVIVLGIVGLSYYAVVVVNYWPALIRGGVDSLYSLAVLLPFHFLLGMLLWSYFSAILTDPGGVPPRWRPVGDEETADAEHLVNSDYNVSDSGVRMSTMHSGSSDDRVRFCRKCNQFKPPRCHHCSVCQRCILKMDHHCVWVVNCVGALNYKYFNLFLFYTFLETTLVSVSLLPYFLAFFTDQEIYGTPAAIAATFMTFVLNVAFALSLLGFLIMHASLVVKNKTTIEAFEKKTNSKWCYDLGWKKNIEQVFGSNERYWFIPAYSEEDVRIMPALHGLEFPTRPDLEALRKF